MQWNPRKSMSYACDGRSIGNANRKNPAFSATSAKKCPRTENKWLISRQKLTPKREVRRWRYRPCGLPSSAERDLIPCLIEVNRTPHLVEKGASAARTAPLPPEISVKWMSTANNKQSNQAGPTRILI